MVKISFFAKQKKQKVRKGKSMKEIISIVLITIVVSISSYLVQIYLEDTGHEILSRLDELKNELIEAQNTKMGL